MIKTNELRLGNLFQDKFSKDYFKILELTEGAVVFDYFTDKVWQAEPIELTEEILLKCGFKHEKMYIIKNLYLIEYGDFYFVLDENNRYYHVKLSNHSFGHEKQVGLGIIKHLHQLQNLYWCLCGKELNIEL